MTIQQNVRQLRQNAGMTQEQVACKLSVTRQTISGYESGRTRPDIDMLLKLAEVYKTDLDGILYGETVKLKATRTVRIMAVAFFCVIIILTVLRSGFSLERQSFLSHACGSAYTGRKSGFCGTAASDQRMGNFGCDHACVRIRGLSSADDRSSCIKMPHSMEN